MSEGSFLLGLITCIVGQLWQGKLECFGGMGGKLVCFFWCVCGGGGGGGGDLFP